MTSVGSRYTQWVFFIGLTLISLVFHSYNLDYASYDLDEAVHIWHAQKPYSDVVEQASNDPNPPVYNLLLSTWVKVFGVSEFATRFLSVLFGSLGVGLMFLIASRNFGLAVGLMAAIFYCFSPIQFRFSHLARPYTMLMVTVLLSYGTLLEAMKNPSNRTLFWYYFTTTAMIYVHPTAVFNLVAQGLIAFVHNLKDIKAWFKLMLPMIAAALSFGIWVLSVPYFERNDAMWFGPPNWEEIKYVLLVFYANWQLIVLQMILVLIALVSAFRNTSQNHKYNLSTILLWALVPFIVSICFSHLIKPVFQDKYILSVQPAMMLLLAFSIYTLRKKALRMAGLLVVFGLLISSIDTTLDPEGDWKSAVNYVKPLHNENSIVFVDPWYEFRTFSYYFNRHAYQVPDSTVKILATERVFTGWHDVYDTIKGVPKTEIVHLMLAHQGFVNTEVDLDKLDKIATRIYEKEFVGIKVLSYRFNEVSESQSNSNRKESDGWTQVSLDQPFSEAVVASLENSNQASQLQVISKVKLNSDYDLNGVVLVTSIEISGQAPFVYQTQELIRLEGQEFTIVDSLYVDEFETDWIVKTYLGNPKGKYFEYRQLEVEIRN